MPNPTGKHGPVGKPNHKQKLYRLLKERGEISGLWLIAAELGITYEYANILIRTSAKRGFVSVPKRGVYRFVEGSAYPLDRRGKEPGSHTAIFRRYNPKSAQNLAGWPNFGKKSHALEQAWGSGVDVFKLAQIARQAKNRLKPAHTRASAVETPEDKEAA